MRSTRYDQGGLFRQTDQLRSRWPGRYEAAGMPFSGPSRRLRRLSVSTMGERMVILVPAGSVLSQGRATMLSRSAISPIRDGRRPQVVSEMFDDHLTTIAPSTIIVMMTRIVDRAAALRWVWFLPPANAVMAQSVVSNHGCATNLEESVLKRGQPRIRAARSGSVPRPSSREDRLWTTTTRKISMT